VEEIFRFASPIERQRAARRGGLTRYASVDIEVDSVTIRAGDTVMFAVQEANEDEAVFADPKRFDITRERIPHLSLSHGLHFCLGAHLARLKLQYLFVRLFERFPALRLAVPLEDIQPVREAVAGAVSQLPVTW
jgi:pentalenolactone synthase